MFVAQQVGKVTDGAVGPCMMCQCGCVGVIMGARGVCCILRVDYLTGSLSYMSAPLLCPPPHPNPTTHSE